MLLIVNLLDGLKNVLSMIRVALYAALILTLSVAHALRLVTLPVTLALGVVTELHLAEGFVLEDVSLVGDDLFLALD